MEGYIKVNPETIQRTAGEFGTQATQLQSLTGEMLQLIQSLGSAWTGEASRAYLQKFAGLQPDMDKMFRMVQEHSTDLQEMATAYQQAENANAEATQSLLTNVLV